MTVNKTTEAIAIMQAYVDGQEIQVRVILSHAEKAAYGEAEWHKIYTNSGITPAWDWSNFEYRVAPDPS